MNFPASANKQWPQAMHDARQHSVESIDDPSEISTLLPITCTVSASSKTPANNARASISGNGSTIAP